MAATPPICDFGWKAVDFTLPGIDGATHSLRQLKGKRATVLAFICNHCPYVKAVMPRLVRDAKDMAPLGIATIAINSNDASHYPDDSFDNMKRFAAEHGFPFHYLHDESQEVARAYGAVCTPDFFGFNADLELHYRGRLDASRKELVPDARRELYDALRLIADTNKGPAEQSASMGCSIKWKTEKPG